MGRGGKRQGAGRPKGHTTRQAALNAVFSEAITTKPEALAPVIAAQPSNLELAARERKIARLKLAPNSGAAKAVRAGEILATVDEVALWQELLFSDDAKVAFWAAQYLTDQRDGKPVQRVLVKDTRDPIERLRDLFKRGIAQAGLAALSRAGAGSAQANPGALPGAGVVVSSGGPDNIR